MPDPGVGRAEGPWPIHLDLAAEYTNTREIPGSSLIKQKKIVTT